MDRRVRPLLRLLVAPVLLLGALLAGLQAFEHTTPGEVDAALDVGDLVPPALAMPPVCRREGVTEPEAVPVQPLLGRRVTSAEVNSCPAAFDGRSVTYVGELVGDLLPRDGGAWALANDDAYALELGPLPHHRRHRGANSGLTVWLPDTLLERVTGLGGPARRGDVVELRGVVHRTDPADGAGLTLRAHTMRVVAPAADVAQPLDARQAMLAVVVLVAAAALWVGRRRAGRAPSSVPDARGRRA